jgi:pimeloyl-ACP methyl ester carboxylesterase
MASFVVVHGAWGGGWEWRDVARLLQADGHEVSRVTLTGLGDRCHGVREDLNLDTHVEDVVRHLRFEGLRDVVLVGHSYGGMVVTGVADRVPERVAKLVYVDALVPRDGEAVFDLLPPDWGVAVRDAAVDGAVPPPPADDLHPAWYAARARAHPLAAFEQPLRLTGRGDDIPRLYIRCLRSDLPLDRVLERVADWPSAEIDTHHDAHIGDAAGLARLLSSAGASS